MNANRCPVEFKNESNDTHIGISHVEVRTTRSSRIYPRAATEQYSLHYPFHFQPSTWPTGRPSRTSLIANLSTVEPMAGLKTGTEKRWDLLRIRRGYNDDRV
jgi:hypothetical protein